MTRIIGTGLDAMLVGGIGTVCPLCGVDPTVEYVRLLDGEAVPFRGHDCHCIRVGSERIAVGICCGHMLGARTLADEDAADAKRRKGVARGEPSPPPRLSSLRAALDGAPERPSTWPT